MFSKNLPLTDLEKRTEDYYIKYYQLFKEVLNRGDSSTVSALNGIVEAKIGEGDEKSEKSTVWRVTFELFYP